MSAAFRVQVLKLESHSTVVYSAAHPVRPLTTDQHQAVADGEHHLRNALVGGNPLVESAGGAPVVATRIEDCAAGQDIVDDEEPLRCEQR